ncbi:hypothetical protein, partial [Natrialba chahannaoensis]|uniref:hypothetical protein n=1 Tax=Natrialba chahannaoensis TaxID=68911 RepID=UPI0019D339F8
PYKGSSETFAERFHGVNIELQPYKGSSETPTPASSSRPMIKLQPYKGSSETGSLIETPTRDPGFNPTKVRLKPCRKSGYESLIRPFTQSNFHRPL